jgi:hypothetical protein
VLEELIGSFDWEVTGSGPVERGFRHWDHWRPSSKLALKLTPRDEDGRRCPSNDRAARQRLSATSS